MPNQINRKLILGSTSAYRRELLSRLQVPFAVESPHVDESAQAGEMPVELAQRLAMAKAQAVARRFPGLRCHWLRSGGGPGRRGTGQAANP
jgi:septum formation protein